MLNLSSQLDALRNAVVILPVAAALGAALGFIRPVRRGLVPRSSHVIQTQVLLAVVGAVIILVVQESLARAFAIVGAAGLVRYRARITDPKDAGVLLAALAIGLLSGAGSLLLATASCFFIIGVLWLLESLEPVDLTQFDLTVESKDALRVRPHVEHALRQRGIHYELWGSSPTELRYEVKVPLDKKVRKLSKLIRNLDKRDGIAVDWRIKKPKVVQT
jgi:uncharacterized membrane protein YhiD involved in acid resistance